MTKQDKKLDEIDCFLDIPQARNLARHFYELGCRHTAVMYDDIEYERQMAEEAEISKGLEDELDKWRHDHFHGERDENFSGEYLERTSQLDLARHFAEWGMNQMPLPEDTTIFQKGVAEGKRLMMEGAVEADVNTYEDLATGESWAEFVVKMPTKNLGDKVRVIVIPEEK